jgi:hypothetical protein
MMAWSKDRKRFSGALALFLVWVAILTLLAVVSAYRPASRTSPALETSQGVTEALGLP